MEFLIKLLLKKVVGVDTLTWESVKDLVLTAENRPITGEQRGEWVAGQVRDLLGYLAPYARQLLIGLAVAWLRQKGLIEAKGNAPKP